MVIVRIARIAAVLAMLIAAGGTIGTASAATGYYEAQQGINLLNQGINLLSNVTRILPQRNQSTLAPGYSTTAAFGCRAYPPGYGYPVQPGCPNSGYGYPGQQPNYGYPNQNSTWGTQQPPVWGTPQPRRVYPSQQPTWGTPQTGQRDFGQIQFKNGIVPPKPAHLDWIASCDASRQFANIFHPVTRQHVGIMNRRC